VEPPLEEPELEELELELAPAPELDPDPPDVEPDDPDPDPPEDDDAKPDDDPEPELVSGEPLPLLEADPSEFSGEPELAPPLHAASAGTPSAIMATIFDDSLIIVPSNR
jgi:hypothetical protein